MEEWLHPIPHPDVASQIYTYESDPARQISHKHVWRHTDPHTYYSTNREPEEVEMLLLVKLDGVLVEIRDRTMCAHCDVKHGDEETSEILINKKLIAVQYPSRNLLVEVCRAHVLWMTKSGKPLGVVTRNCDSEGFKAATEKPNLINSLHLWQVEVQTHTCVNL